ncbi:antibiotic biosynthesis monooxygenase [Cytophaga sp. FL35]|nr:antibiotic biosynthesis monooxygenase [Cytophaga sp. FL35]
MMVRIAVLEIYPEHLQDYLTILKEEAEASVRLEKGVICIYPMYIEENENQIRLLEIYANRKAYEEHLNSPHFKHYKTATLKMVKKLELIDMKPIDKETMPDIFKKMGQLSD